MRILGSLNVTLSNSPSFSLKAEGCKGFLAFNWGYVKGLNNFIWRLFNPSCILNMSVHIFSMNLHWYFTVRFVMLAWLLPAYVAIWTKFLQFCPVQQIPVGAVMQNKCTTCLLQMLSRSGLVARQVLRTCPKHHMMPASMSTVRPPVDMLSEDEMMIRETGILITYRFTTSLFESSINLINWFTTSRNN